MAPDTARRPATVSDAPDKAALRAWRLGRLRQELEARDYAGALLYDPIHIRYACDVRNMQVWCLHNAARYVFVPTEGQRQEARRVVSECVSTCRSRCCAY